jgi:L-ascorbate metabolism protein UlaG (beta-lactamase superfamily)
LTPYNDQKIIEIDKVKNCIQTFLFISFILLLNCSKDHNNDIRQKATGESEIEITYINNEGFIITSKEKKIIFDGLLNFDISKENQIKMVKAEPPFNNIDLVLATHDHADHFDANIVGRHLLNNKKAIFISTEQALKELQTEFDKFNKISDRVISIYPNEGEKISNIINGIELEIYNLRHGLNSTMQNLGFLIQINNKRIFHIGDAQEITLDDIRAYEIDKIEIDIAFMPYWYLIYKENREVFQDIIRDSKVIAMHLGWVDEGGKEVIGQLEAEYSDAIIFNMPMELKIFN